MNDEVDSFAAMFSGPPGEKQREARKARVKAERRTQLTEKQRTNKRNAVRTDQIGFRCSPEFHERVKRMTKQLGCSTADLMERALELFATDKGREGHE